MKQSKNIYWHLPNAPAPELVNLRNHHPLTNAIAEQEEYKQLPPKSWSTSTSTSGSGSRSSQTRSRCRCNLELRQLAMIGCLG